MSITDDTRIVRGACAHDCPDTCAMLVTVENGKATKVRGDPDHPFTRGGLCVKVNDYTEHAYSPDRVLYPLRRVGPKGEGRFERISWDEALDEIATRFRAIIDEHGSQAIWPYSYLGTEGILNGLTVGDPFFHRLGATVSERTFCDSGGITAYLMTLGPAAGMDPESFVHSRYIILWACNVRSTNLHMWPFIKEAQDRGAKVVVIDPLRHRTAQSADWYIPIRPGTDGALALAMMHVIINEGLIDKDYVANHTVGFEELSERVQQYPPDWASTVTGIPVEDIVTLAREYATTQPSAIRIGVALERHAGGGQAVRAVTSLPALVGAWRNVGGGILTMPLWAFPVQWGTLSRPELIRPGTRVLNQWLLGPALTGELDLARHHQIVLGDERQDTSSEVGRMVDVSTLIEIERPRAEVAAYASDPDNATAWYNKIKTTEGAAPRVHHGLRHPAGQRQGPRPAQEDSGGRQPAFMTRSDFDGPRRERTRRGRHQPARTSR